MTARVRRAIWITWRGILAVSVLFSALLLLWSVNAIPWPWRAFELKKIRASEGFGFTSKMPDPWIAFAYAPKSGILTEDGRPLAPASENGIVRDRGRGAFRVGGERVLFSTSDGSDPLTNGRTYRLKIQTVVPPSFRAFIIGAGGLAVLLLLGKKVFAIAAWLRCSDTTSAHVKPPLSTSAWALALFAIALAVRVGFLWLNPDYTDGQMSIRGTPYSDAKGWLDMAKATARGGGVDTAFPGMRALYPMFLANFFTWFGDSVPLAKGLQAMIGAASAALIFLILRRAMPLWSALAAALFFAVDPRQVTQAGKLMTEPFGLLLTMLSAWCLIVGGERRRIGLLFVAGAFLACSNLARPLTLFAFPFFVAVIAVNAFLRDPRRWRAAVFHPAAFAIGTVICLAPWVIRERVVHGIWAISANSSSALFAASTPEFGVWGNGVESLAAESGVSNTVKSRYDFYQARFQENLNKYPGFYAANVARSFAVAAKGCSNVSPVFLGAAVGAMAALGLMALRFGSMKTILLIVLPAIPATALLAVTENQYATALAILGAAVTLWWRPFPAAVLIVCHGGGLLGSALFGNPDLQRVRLLIDWVEAGWTFAGVLALAGIIVAVVIHVPVRALLSVPAGQIRDCADDRTAPWLRWIAWGFAAFLFVSTSRLVFLNGIKTPPPPSPLRLSDTERSLLLQDFVSRFPTWQRMSDPALMEATRIWRRRAFVEFGVIEKQAYEFPANIGFQHWTNRFEPRPYGHISFIFRGSGESFTGEVWTEFAGQVPPELRDSICILIGLTKIRPAADPYLTRSVEAIAIIPAPDFKPDFNRAIVAPPFPETSTLIEAPTAPK